MGNKIILILCLLTSLSYAHDITSTYSNDKDTQIKSISYNNDFGIKVSNYTTKSNNYTSYGITYKNNDGYVGISLKDNHYYIISDYNKNIKLNEYNTLNLSVFSDIVDSPKSLQNNIHYNGILVANEFNYKNMGILAGPKVMYYSDDNWQKGFILKSWYSIYNGVNIYYTHKQYVMNQYSNNYFSPSAYIRNGFGISVRKRFENFVLYSFIEPTIIKTKYSSEPALAYKIELTFNDFIVYIGQDSGSVSNFNYIYAGINIKF